MKNDTEDRLELPLLEAVMEARHLAHKDPSPENNQRLQQARSALYDYYELLPAFDWETYNKVAEWINKLEEKFKNTTDDIILAAITAGEEYLNNPNVDTKLRVDDMSKKVAEKEDNSQNIRRE